MLFTLIAARSLLKMKYVSFIFCLLEQSKSFRQIAVNGEKSLPLHFDDITPFQT